MFSFQQFNQILLLSEMPHGVVDYEVEKAFAHEQLISFLEDKSNKEVLEKEDLIRDNAWKEVKFLLLTICQQLKDIEQLVPEDFKIDLENSHPLVLEINKEQFSGRYVSDVYLEHLLNFFKEVKDNLSINISTLFLSSDSKKIDKKAIDKVKEEEKDITSRFQRLLIPKDLYFSALKFMLDESDKFVTNFKHSFFTKIKNFLEDKED